MIRHLYSFVELLKRSNDTRVYVTIFIKDIISLFRNVILHL